LPEPDSPPFFIDPKLPDFLKKAYKQTVFSSRQTLSGRFAAGSESLRNACFNEKTDKTGNKVHM